LDFSKIKDWSAWTITNKKDELSGGQDMIEGDPLSVVLPGNSFSPTVQENKPDLFAWLGSIPYIFTGRHEFRFRESTSHAGGTTFTQSEEFTGALSFLMGPGWSMREKTAMVWSKFNEDLKAEAEKRASG
jgi:hypothetical protein